MRRFVTLMIGSFLVAGAAAQAAPREDPQVQLARTRLNALRDAPAALDPGGP